MIRLFASMRTCMYFEGAAIFEALSASRSITQVRSFIGVYFQVSLQVPFSMEALARFSIRWPRRSLGVAHTLVQNFQSHRNTRICFCMAD